MLLLMSSSLRVGDHVVCVTDVLSGVGVPGIGVVSSVVDLMGVDGGYGGR